MPPKERLPNTRLAEAQRQMEAEAASYPGGLRRPLGIKPLEKALDSLMAQKGYNRMLGTSDLERAWMAALGPAKAGMTKLGTMRRGVINVTVAHSSLLEELRQFRKPALLAALRKTSAGSGLCDIRFRLGWVEGAAGSSASKSRGSGRDGAESDPRD